MKSLKACQAIWHSRWHSNYRVCCWLQGPCMTEPQDRWCRYAIKKTEIKVNAILGAARYHSSGRWYPEKEYNETPRSCVNWQKCLSSNKKELQYVLGIMNYLGKFWPSIAEVCNSLRKLALSKCKWTWNNTCQNYMTGPRTLSRWMHP